MPTRKELIDELDVNIEESVQLTEDEKKSKVNRRLIATGMLLILLNYNEDRYFKGTISTLTLANRRKLLSDSKIMANFNKELKKRRKKVNYGRMVRRQANIFQNQVRKTGIKTATSKLKKRVDNILQTEGNTFRDRGKVTAGKVVNKTTNKIVTKVWKCFLNFSKT